jgi:hypothetical protein
MRSGRGISPFPATTSNAGTRGAVVGDLARHDGPLPSALDEPVARAPFVLGEQHPAKLCEGLCPGIVERPQDALAVLDSERDDAGLERERLLKKRAHRLIHERDELADVVVGNLQAGVLHGDGGTP